MTAVKRAWHDVQAEAMMPGVTRRFVHGEQAMVAQIELRAGAVVPWHEHANEQISVLLSGRARFEFGGTAAPEVVEAGAGDTIVIPGHLPHQVTVLEDAQVIDVFAPPRTDWVAARQEAADAR
ncbi:cupin domain-containing protein [uncultured Deinococcus sp.]|uniref:cupin domain-containing protein n=1 Tax=uncultured Deinococcus sp. TaxID=158789 RepID=UPI0025D0F16E|nr:cupin domain-containing protein [uncultured Deinococcus sp.]